jgi:hypothetical protein
MKLTALRLAANWPAILVEAVVEPSEPLGASRMDLSGVEPLTSTLPV